MTATTATTAARQELQHHREQIAHEVNQIAVRAAEVDAEFARVIREIELDDLDSAAAGPDALLERLLELVWPWGASEDLQTTTRRVDDMRPGLHQAVTPLFALPHHLQKGLRARLADRQAVVDAESARARRAEAYKVQLKRDAELHQQRLLGEDI